MRKVLLQRCTVIGVFFTFFSLLDYPAKAQLLCVRTTSGRIESGEPLRETIRGGSNRGAVNENRDNWIAQRVQAVRQIDGFAFGLVGCGLNRQGEPRCDFLVANLQQSDRELWITAGGSRFISTSGDVLRNDRSGIGSDTAVCCPGWATDTLIHRVPVNGFISAGSLNYNRSQIQNFLRRARRLAVVEIGFGYYNPDRSITNRVIRFQNVPISR